MVSDLDLGLKRPDNFPLAIWEKLLVVNKDLDIGTRPDNITPITQVTMVDFCVYLFHIAMWIIVFIKMKNVMAGVMVKDRGLDLKRSATLTFKIMDKVLMVMG